MKKFLGILLSLGLIMAFAMPVAAAEFTLGGMWYMAGLYADNPSLLDKSTTWPSDPSWGTNNTTGAPMYPVRTYNMTTGVATYVGDSRTARGAAAYYTHKLTLKPTVQIVEGLSFHMQIDALEGVMSDTTWNASTNQRTSNSTSSRTSYGSQGVLTQDNIEFEQAYINFKTALGQIRAGYQYGNWFGTTFLSQPYTRPRIVYNNAFGPVAFEASIVKSREYRNRSNYGTGVQSNGVANDSDGDIYAMSGIYKFGMGEVGLEYEYWRDAAFKTSPPAGTNGYMTVLSRLNPYAKMKFGPAYIEAEGFYNFGTIRKYEAWSAGQTVVPDVSLNAFGAYIMGQVDFKPFFVGAKFIYKSGNDQQSADKQTGGIAVMYGDDYGSPAAGTLILYDSMYIDSMGSNIGNAITAPSTRYIDNVWFYQLFGGVNPTAKLNITGKLSYATADKKPRLGTGDVSAANPEFVSDKYGTEIDLIATYKIYDNLSYMVGAGYLFVGEYFKGFDSNAKVKDNYLLTHRLTLNF